MNGESSLRRDPGIVSGLNWMGCLLKWSSTLCPLGGVAVITFIMCRTVTRLQQV